MWFVWSGRSRERSKSAMFKEYVVLIAGSETMKMARVLQADGEIRDRAQDYSTDVPTIQLFYRQCYRKIDIRPLRSR